MEKYSVSKPVYHPLVLDTAGRRHLMVTDQSTIPDGAVAEEALLAQAEIWTVARSSTVVPTGVTREHRSAEHLREMLARRLGSETMGLRLYVAGSEPFIWSIDALARVAGLGRHELHMFAPGSGARRVWCAHCHTVTPGARMDHVTCSGCNVILYVRSHFSRRLNAYQGVQADVESIGELPVPEPFAS